MNFFGSDQSLIFSNGSDGEVIWLNVRQKNIKIEILDKLGETQKILDLLPNQGTRVPARGKIRRVLY